MIEINDSSSSVSSPYPNGRHDDDEHMEPPKRESAASRVSLANLLGPSGPGSNASPYPSPPRSSSRKPSTDAQTTVASSSAQATTVEDAQPSTNGHHANGSASDSAQAGEPSSPAKDEDQDQEDASSSDEGSASDDAGPSKEAGQDGAAKTKKRAKRRSPSPPEPAGPAGPPARPTIRISLADSKKDGYLFNIPELVYEQLKAKKHPWAKWYEEQAEILEVPAPVPSAPAGMGELGGLAKLLAKYPGDAAGANKRRRRGGRADDDGYDIGTYDVKDPFVDDSELGVDEPTHFAKPKADGFYVTQGPVELAKVKPGKRGLPGAPRERAKPLSIRDAKSGFAGSINKLIAKRAQATGSVPAPPPAASTANGGGSMHLTSLLNSSAASGSPELRQTPGPLSTPNSKAEGTRESPIKVDDNDDSTSKPVSKKNRYPTLPVDPRLQAQFEHLKNLVSKESFAVKTRFPPNLKPPLIETAKLAVELGEYNDNFFNYLPTIFPYNRFTMMKLTKREFFQHHIKYFKDLQDEHMENLGRLIRESYPTQLAEYEAAHKAWEDRGGPEQEGETAAAKPTGDGDMDVDGARPSEEDRKLICLGKHLSSLCQGVVLTSFPTVIEPQKRWKWSEEMREEVFTLITIENAMSEIRNEKM